MDRFDFPDAKYRFIRSHLTSDTARFFLLFPVIVPAGLLSESNNLRPRRLAAVRDFPSPSGDEREASPKEKTFPFGLAEIGKARRGRAWENHFFGKKMAVP